MSIREANALRVLQNSNTVAERVKNTQIALINKDFSSNPSYREVLRNGTQTIGVIITDNSSNATTKVDNIRSIIMKPDDVLNVGDVFDYNEQKWICTSAEMFSDIYYRGTITQANNTLTFYKTQILRTLPCIIQTSGANYLDLDENRFISSPNGKYTCICPDLGYITKSDLNLRFILKGSGYKIGGINNLNNGLIVLELVDDKLIPDDRPDLGIANWFSNQRTEQPPQEEIVVTPTVTTLTVAKSTIFEARFFNEGVEDLLIHFNWMITNDDGSSNTYVNIVPNNRTCTITPINSPSAIGKVINLKVSLVENPTRFIIKQYKIVSLI